MPLDDTLHDRQSHPGVVILVGAVQPLEHPEELVRVAQFLLAFVDGCSWSIKSNLYSSKTRQFPRNGLENDAA
jgi:hypothetical protein